MMKYLYKYLRLIIVLALVAMLIFVQTYFFGRSDTITMMIILATAFVIFLTSMQLFTNNRKLLGMYANDDGILHEYAEKKTTVLQWIIVPIMSLILAALFMVFLKGMVINQGLIVTAVILFPFSLWLYQHNNKHSKNSLISQSINQSINNIQEESAQHNIKKLFNKHIREHIDIITKILVPAIILNLILSIIFSTHNTYLFKSTDINFINFIEYSSNSPNIIENNGHNFYSKNIINAQILIENLQTAFNKYLVEQLFKLDNFFVLLSFSLIFNLIKHMFFCWTYIIVFNGIEKLTDFLYERMKKLIKPRSES